MSEQFSNNAETTLNGDITNVATTLVVTSATGFPASGNFRILIKADGVNADEICTVTSVSGTTFTISRASEATAGTQSAVAHLSGSTIAHVLTAASVRAFHEYLGYNTVGASTESGVNLTIYAKSFTPSVSGMLLAIGIHMKFQADASFGAWVGIYADNSGSPGDLIAVSRAGGPNSGTAAFDLHHSSEVDQWIDIPIASYLTGGTTYWMGWAIGADGGGTQPLLYYDTSGSDKSIARSNFLAFSGQLVTWSSTSKKYSIRGDFLAVS